MSLGIRSDPLAYSKGVSGGRRNVKKARKPDRLGSGEIRGCIGKKNFRKYSREDRRESPFNYAGREGEEPGSGYLRAVRYGRR